MLLATLNSRCVSEDKQSRKQMGNGWTVKYDWGMGQMGGSNLMVMRVMTQFLGTIVLKVVQSIPLASPYQLTTFSASSLMVTSSTTTIDLQIRDRQLVMSSNPSVPLLSLSISRNRNLYLSSRGVLMWNTFRVSMKLSKVSFLPIPFLCSKTSCSLPKNMNPLMTMMSYKSLMLISRMFFSLAWTNILFRNAYSTLVQGGLSESAPDLEFFCATSKRLVQTQSPETLLPIVITMGSICLSTDQPLEGMAPINTHAYTSFFVSPSQHCQCFLGFKDFPIINQLIRGAIIEGTNLESTLRKLQGYDEAIAYELLSFGDDIQSKILNRKLQTISMEISEAKAIGYLTFEIQRIELLVKKTKVKVEVWLDDGLSLRENYKVTDYAIDTPALFMESPTSAKQIVIKINDFTCTLDLTEVRNHLLITERLNLKSSQQILSPKGNVLVRIQFIEDVQVWKRDMKEKLTLKLDQIRRITECLKKLIKTNDPHPTKVLMEYLEDQLPTSRQPSGSFYDNLFEI